jgi:putative acetyltransferase
VNLTIRPYTPADLAACRALWVELTQRHRDIYADQSIGGADPSSYFDTAYLRLPNLRGPWVVELDGRVVGLSGLLVDGDHGEVEPVVVAADVRSQGVGQRLVEHVIAEARAAGVRLLSVRPVARNVEAIDFFVRAGFGALGHVDLFQDLSASPDRQLKSGITLHGHELRY